MHHPSGILLYNPISGHGHLDGWHAMFASILLQRGYAVYCFTPDTAALALRLRQRGLEQHPNITILPLPAPYCDTGPCHGLRRRFKDRIANRLRGLANTYVKHPERGRITPDMPFSRRSKKRLAQLLIPLAYAVFRAIRWLVRLTPAAVRTMPDAEAGFLSPGEWGRRMKTALQTLPPSRYFLFNMYMDMYRTDQASWKEFDHYCRLPWAGIRFVPGSAPRETYYDLSSLRGMCFLDERLCRAYAEALPKKRFTYLPDVTDATLPLVLPPVARAITKRAVGRKVVFMGGSIGGQKNITLWRELIRLADPQRFFFAQVGEIHYSTCSREEQDMVHSLAAAPPENFLMLAEYLPDERDFNACIAACDIIFAVYKNFRISSNMPGKAAAFGKPILVSDGYLMGEVVRRYGLGAAVPEDDLKEALAALEILIHTAPAQENFAAYSAMHNEEALSMVLTEFIDACLKDLSVMVGCENTIR